VSFDHWDLIPREDFESIEEWHADSDRKYLVGILSFETLRQKSWWRDHNTSLILMPDPIIENLDLKQLKKKSLELAGVF
jgi:homoserine dehydrogenase